MKSVLVVLILIVLAAAVARSRRTPRKHQSQFFRHTFDESGAGDVPKAHEREPS